MTQIEHSPELLNYVIPVSLGDQVYYEIRPGFIIPATVTQLSYVATPTKELEKEFNLVPNGSVWIYVSNQGIHIVGTTIEKDLISGWNFTKVLPESSISQLKAVNQFFDIDEIIGHSVQIYRNGSVSDGVYLTLQHAMVNATSIDKRQAKRAHKKIQKSRNRKTGFVRSTGNLECPVITSQKKIYVKTYGLREYNWIVPKYGKRTRVHKDLLKYYKR